MCFSGYNSVMSGKDSNNHWNVSLFLLSEARLKNILEIDPQKKKGLFNLSTFPIPKIPASMGMIVYFTYKDH